ncbi:MAG: zinc ribbon domain-containing protein [Phycisphaerales bacterium]
MSVTDQLLRLHKVDRKLRELRSRLASAERYLKAQEQQLTDLQKRREAVNAQVRQLQASVHNDESEMGSIDDRIAKLRDQLNSAKTSKEYSAFLSEINTFKADKGQVEERALEAMTRLDELKATLTEIDNEVTERTSIRDVAKNDLKKREADAKDQLEALIADREQAANEVPSDALAVFDSIAARIEPHEDVMAPIEEHSRRSMEYACGGCQTMLPVELVSRLLGKGDLTRCVSCGSILYMEETLRESMMAAKK